MKRRRTLKLLVWMSVLGVTAYYALAGGEYSMVEARRAKTELALQQAKLAQVRHEIDSLRARIDSLENNDEMLERVARERYGFIRDGEYLYRFYEAEPDSGGEDRKE